MIFQCQYIEKSCYVHLVNWRFGKHIAGFSSAWLLQLRTYPQMCLVSIMQLLLGVKIWIRISIFERITCLFWSIAGCQVPLKIWLPVPLTLPQSKWVQCPRGGVPSYSTKCATLCPLNITLTLTVPHSFSFACMPAASLCLINLHLFWKYWIKISSCSGALGFSYKLRGSSGLSLSDLLTCIFTLFVQFNGASLPELVSDATV